MPTIDDIHSNNKKVCLACGCEITQFNDSGWEQFTEDGVTTQPVCKKCSEDADGVTVKETYIKLQ